MICYMITNKINGKRYIGITKRSLRVRWTGHIAGARHGNKVIFANAIRKYGAENFECRVVYEATSMQELFAVEKGLIAQYAPEYNMDSGGNDSPWRADRVKRVSAMAKKRCEDPKERERLSAVQHKRWATPGAKESASEIQSSIWDETRKSHFSKLMLARRKANHPQFAKGLAGIKKRMNDPEIKIKMLAATRKYWDNPENKIKHEEIRQRVNLIKGVTIGWMFYMIKRYPPVHANG